MKQSPFPPSRAGLIGSLAAAIVAVMGVLWVMTSCAAEQLPESQTSATAGYGYVSFESGIAMTRAIGDDFEVSIVRLGPTWYIGDEMFRDTYFNCRGDYPLLEGFYSLSVKSPAVELPAFDAPTYAGGVDSFEILTGETTRLGQVVCTQTNVKTTVSYSSNLQKVVADANVRVTVDGEYLDFPYGEARAGYFAADGPVTMLVEFSGMISNSPAFYDNEFTVSPGEWERIHFALEGDDELHIILEGSSAGQIEQGAEWKLY